MIYGDGDFGFRGKTNIVHYVRERDLGKFEVLDEKPEWAKHAAEHFGRIGTGSWILCHTDCVEYRGYGTSINKGAIGQVTGKNEEADVFETAGRAMLERVTKV